MKQYPIITVVSQYGSGGRQIGERLAERLDIPFYRGDICERAEAALQDDALACRGAQGALFYALATGTESDVGGAMSPILPAGDRQFLEKRDAIRSLAAQGPCVIMADCGEVVLREIENRLSIFICADLDDRIRRVAAEDRLSDADAVKRLKKEDKRRRGYYDFYTGERWGLPERYALCINSSTWGLEGAVDAIEYAVEKRTRGE